MKRLFFTKLSGAGNDFVLFDKNHNPEFELNTQFIAKVCNRRTGIGADGVIVISNREQTAFEMQYFNADGTTGSLCANGARSALRYCKVNGRIGLAPVKFIANDLEYLGQILDDQKIKFYLNETKRLKVKFKIKAAGQLITAAFIDTGAPHVVIKIDDVLVNTSNPGVFFSNIDEFPVRELGREIRYSKDFAPEGTNVNFISLVNGVIQIRSYERGVEDETLSCGTGSVAAALVTYFNQSVPPPIKLLAKSGDELIVDFKVNNQIVRDLSLTGPAEIIFKGELLI